MNKTKLKPGVTGAITVNKRLVSFGIYSIVLLGAVLLVAYVLPDTPKLDKWVGVRMDESFVGPATSWVVNLLLDTPGVTDNYSLGGPNVRLLLFLFLFAACFATGCAWCCLLGVEIVKVTRAELFRRKKVTPIL